jgi:biopolymer transport protein ExbB/TolQ
MSFLFSPDFASIAYWPPVAMAGAVCFLVAVKARQLSRCAAGNREFDAAFRAAHALRAAACVTDNGSGLARLANVGLGVASLGRHELLEPNLDRQLVHERRRLASGLTLLSCLAGAAPFSSLLGSLWLIGESTADVHFRVGISLIGIMGMAGTVLAVLALVYVSRRVRLMSATLEDFACDFLLMARSPEWRFDLISHVASRPERSANAAGFPHLRVVAVNERLA